MTSKADVLRMAREAGFHSPVRADGYMGLAYDRREGRETGGSLERFAALVRADEREQCAKVCDELHPGLATKRAAEIIRARGAGMKRLPKGKTAQVMGSRFFQTMYTADQMRKYADKAVEDEREACAKMVEGLFDDPNDSVLAFIVDAIRARGSNITDNYASEDDTQELLDLGSLPEPLRLAAMLEKTMQSPLHGKAADCLRRMYAAREKP